MLAAHDQRMSGCTLNVMKSIHPIAHLWYRQLRVVFVYRACVQDLQDCFCKRQLTSVCPIKSTVLHLNDLRYCCCAVLAGASVSGRHAALQQPAVPQLLPAGEAPTCAVCQLRMHCIELSAKAFSTNLVVERACAPNRSNHRVSHGFRCVLWSSDPSLLSRAPVN
jgi:hypothetical protein